VGRRDETIGCLDASVIDALEGSSRVSDAMRRSVYHRFRARSGCPIIHVQGNPLRSLDACGAALILRGLAEEFLG
jgi:hypothetical protein